MHPLPHLPPQLCLGGELLPDVMNVMDLLLGITKAILMVLDCASYNTMTGVLGELLRRTEVVIPGKFARQNIYLHTLMRVYPMMMIRCMSMKI